MCVCVSLWLFGLIFEVQRGYECVFMLVCMCLFVSWRGHVWKALAGEMVVVGRVVGLCLAPSSIKWSLLLPNM